MKARIAALGICMLALALTGPTILANATDIEIPGLVGEARAASASCAVDLQGYSISVICVLSPR